MTAQWQIQDFHRGGANPQSGGGAGIKFNFFFRKLHEIEKNLAARGAPPPRSATAAVVRMLQEIKALTKKQPSFRYRLIP